MKTTIIVLGLLGFLTMNGMKHGNTWPIPKRKLPRTQCVYNFAEYLQEQCNLQCLRVLQLAEIEDWVPRSETIECILRNKPYIQPDLWRRTMEALRFKQLSYLKKLENQ